MRKIWPLILVLALTLAACRRAAPSDPEVTIEKTIGDEFQIVAESDPGSGYQWKLKGGYNQKIVRQLGSYQQSDGLDILVFRAVGAGRAELILESYAPSTGTPREIRTFIVVVDDD